jgi:GGDEF domain-containing protein
MLEFGCDDYVVTPASPTELQQLFGTPPMRLTTVQNRVDESNLPMEVQAPSRLTNLLGLPLAEIFLDAMMQHPQEAPNLAVQQINTRIGPTHWLSLSSSSDSPEVPDGFVLLSHAVRSSEPATLHLIMPRDEDEASARHALTQLSLLMAKSLALRERHRKMLKLAFTDDLTGIANGRWFRQHLEHKISEAKEKYLLVTLLIFDIDNFKQYNDQYGHGVGDDILKQTASLIKRCVRPTDLVARISGDEFAVVFFDPEGPRQPRDPTIDPSRSRVPPSVQALCERIRRLISSPEYQVLGTQGQGMLTISGGISVYPYDAQTSEGLISAADRALMFDAKRGGKNSITIVGGDEHLR